MSTEELNAIGESIFGHQRIGIEKENIIAGSLLQGQIVGSTESCILGMGNQMQTRITRLRKTLLQIGNGIVM